MTVMRCDVPAEFQGWCPEPFPGSEAAFKMGCTCPQNQPWPGALPFDLSCPVHELERVKS